MPIKITDNNNNEIAWLCSDEWELSQQLIALEYWLTENKSLNVTGGCVADIGFSPRAKAAGGGSSRQIWCLDIDPAAT